MENKLQATKDSEKFIGNMTINGRKYKWHINTDFKLIVELDSEQGGDLNDTDRQTLKEVIKSGDPRMGNDIMTK